MQPKREKGLVKDVLVQSYICPYNFLLFHLLSIA